MLLPILVPEMTGSERPDTATRPAKCRVTIRFPHVDPAGIVFYPRYFETVSRCFADLPFSATPFAIKTQFLRPNRLGDTLDIELLGGNDWSISGRMDGDECFSIRPLTGSTELANDAHLQPALAFRTTAETLGEWACGTNGHMQLSRYFEFLNMAIEEWLEDRLEMPFPNMHLGRRVGIPTVQFNTRCRRLPEVGESVSTWIRPTKLGDRAMTFRSWFVCGNECVVENEQVVVFVHMQERGYASMPIPGDMRARFAEQMNASGARQ